MSGVTVVVGRAGDGVTGAGSYPVGLDYSIWRGGLLPGWDHP